MTGEHVHAHDQAPGGGAWLVLDVIVTATVAGLVALGIEWLWRQYKATRASASTSTAAGRPLVDLDALARAVDRQGGQVSPDPESTSGAQP